MHQPDALLTCLMCKYVKFGFSLNQKYFVSLSFYTYFLGPQAEAGPSLMIGTRGHWFLQSHLFLLLQPFSHPLFSLPHNILCPIHLVLCPHSSHYSSLLGNNLPPLLTYPLQVIPLPQQMYPIPGYLLVLSPHSQPLQYPQYHQHTFCRRRSSTDSSVG